MNNVTGKSTQVSALVLSTATHAKVVEAYRVLHALVWEVPGLDNLPTKFEDCGTAEYNKIQDRAHRAVVAFRKGAETSQYSDIRDALNAKIDGAKVNGVKALATYNALPADVKALLGASAPTQVFVPVSSVMSCFPADTNKEQATKILHTLGFKLAKGNAKEGSRIAVSLLDESDLAAAAQ